MQKDNKSFKGDLDMNANKYLLLLATLITYAYADNPVYTIVIPDDYARAQFDTNDALNFRLFQFAGSVLMVLPIEQAPAKNNKQCYAPTYKGHQPTRTKKIKPQKRIGGRMVRR